MKIYTKTGDNGTTGLYDGTRVGKDEQIIEVLGTIDELSAHIGVLLALLKQPPPYTSRILPFTEDTKHHNVIWMFLPTIQRKLLDIGSILATPNPKNELVLPKIEEGDVTHIESYIDALTSSLPPLTRFIVQLGTNPIEAHSHVCRVVTRRAERELNRYGNCNENIFKFFNRLSDFFFTFARYVSEKQLN
jgi:cob(I)alamin adenosyltransferase